MRTSRAFARPTICLATALTICLAASSPALAGWNYVQGNLAEVQNLDATTNPHNTHLGWGLTFTQISGTWNWVQFPISGPGAPLTGVRKIRLQFATGSIDAYINAIHVYNGSTKVAEFTGLNWSGPTQEQTIDLGTKMSFTSGLNLAIEVGAGLEAMDHTFWFIAAGANWK
jgi:hypothetical protein